MQYAPRRRHGAARDVHARVGARALAPRRQVGFPPGVTDFILFLHVLAAFMLVATVVMSSAIALGAAAPARVAWISDRLWDVGGIGTLVLGIYLAVDIDGYDLLDGWILAAIVLWVVATFLALRAREQLVPWHWLRSLVVLLLLIDMIWKPGA